VDHQSSLFSSFQKRVFSVPVDSFMKQFFIARLDFKLNQDFDLATASTDEEIKTLGAAGYQKYDERMIG
jgi:hypothetical protein